MLLEMIENVLFLSVIVSVFKLLNIGGRKKSLFFCKKKNMKAYILYPFLLVPIDKRAQSIHS